MSQWRQRTDSWMSSPKQVVTASRWPCWISTLYSVRSTSAASFISPASSSKQPHQTQHSTPGNEGSALWRCRAVIIDQVLLYLWQ